MHCFCKIVPVALQEIQRRKTFEAVSMPEVCEEQGQDFPDTVHSELKE